MISSTSALAHLATILALGFSTYPCRSPRPCPLSRITTHLFPSEVYLEYRVKLEVRCTPRRALGSNANGKAATARTISNERTTSSAIFEQSTSHPMPGPVL
ncbi:hypothetical protein BDW75DRAFT_206580 [Aspergillus navahoensis]